MFREEEEEVSRSFFLSFTTSKITEKVGLPKKATGKTSAFSLWMLVDVMIIVLTWQICILELSNQVLKLVCFKDLE